MLPLTKTGVFVNYTDLRIRNPNVEKQTLIAQRIANHFSLTHVPPVGPVKRHKCVKWSRKDRRLILPRFCTEVLNSKFMLHDYEIASQLSAGDKLTADIKFTGALTENQTVIFNHIQEKYYTPEKVSSGQAGLILNLEAGQGKTYLAAYFISVIKRKTAVILHSTSILEQWRRALIKCYPGLRIGAYYSDEKTDGDVVLMIINSAGSTEFTTNGTTVPALDYYNRFGFVIFDECHVYCNDLGSKAFTKAQAPYMLGLSATPEENANNFDKIIQWNIGPILNAAELPGYKTSTNKFTGLVYKVKYSAKPEYSKVLKSGTGMISVSSTISMLCEDPDRLAVVVECVMRCLRSSLNVFVFCDRRTYAAEIIRVLNDKHHVLGFVLDSEADFMRIVGGTSDEDMQLAEEKARVVATTYQYMGTGKSIGKMNGLVLATPRKSKMEQYIKRIFRLGSDESVTRQIYDVVDQKVAVKSQWYHRKKYYDQMGYPIEDLPATDLVADQKPQTPDQTQAQDVPEVKSQIRQMSALASKLLDKLKK